MRYVSTTEASKILNCTVATIHNWYKWGILRGVYLQKKKDGRSFLFIEMDSIKEKIQEFYINGASDRLEEL